MEKLRRLLQKLGKEELLEGMGEEGGEGKESYDINPEKKGGLKGLASESSHMKEEADEMDDLAKLEAIIPKLSSKHQGMV